jgi:hypothetical protein
LGFATILQWLHIHATGCAASSDKRAVSGHMFKRMRRCLCLLRGRGSDFSSAVERCWLPRRCRCVQLCRILYRATLRQTLVARSLVAGACAVGIPSVSGRFLRSRNKHSGGSLPRARRPLLTFHRNSRKLAAPCPFGHRLRRMLQSASCVQRLVRVLVQRSRRAPAAGQRWHLHRRAERVAMAALTFHMRSAPSRHVEVERRS